MDRRTFIVVAASGLLAAPLAVYGQPSSKRYRVGLLGAESASYDAPRLQILRSRLRELGYAEGRNLVIETRFADGNYDRLPVLASELVGLKVDVLVASGSKAGFAASRATATIPVVVSNMGDAINPGFVANYAQPGGNVTGMSMLNPEVTAKQLELLKQIKPRSTTVAILLNPANPNSALVLETLKRRAEALNVTVEPVEVRRPDELERAFSNMGRAGIDALVVQSETMFFASAKVLGDLAIKHRIAMAGTLVVVSAGGVIGYAANRTEAWAELIGYVDKILKGAKPSDLPVQQPSKVELIVNLKTAKALGLTIPQALLLRADEVIK